MFDIGWQELFIVAILALLVVGPKDLPRALRTVMGLVRKARMMARDFQEGIDDVVREADLVDMKNRIEDLSDGDINEQIQEAIGSTGDLVSDLGLTEIKEELNEDVSKKLDISNALPSDLSSEPVSEKAKMSQSNSDKDT
jgi:sec-independent protein translocase protein TatB